MNQNRPVNSPSSAGPLAGVRVLELSRVLAGPWCGQIFGDLGAEVIKIEQAGAGDDTRQWGPPFLSDDSMDSSYFACANRNKRSLAINLADQAGAALVRRLAAESDIVLENFRVGGLKKFDLDYDTIHALNPGVVWCSITGFGQYGLYSQRGGYDFLIQGMSGLMSVTGTADGMAVKAGIPVADLATGLYAAIATLAALRHRDSTGIGQKIDCSLLDSQMALLANQGSAYLNGGVVPGRMGNAHPNIVPYQDFQCRDGTILVALANDRQFVAFCELLGMGELCLDPRFAKSAARSNNRDALLARLQPVIATWQSHALLEAMDSARLPAGKLNEVPEALADPHVVERGLVKTCNRDDGTPVHFLGFPLQFEATPASYRLPPPRLGQHSKEILTSRLGLDDAQIDELLRAGIIGGE